MSIMSTPIYEIVLVYWRLTKEGKFIGDKPVRRHYNNLTYKQVQECIKTVIDTRKVMLLDCSIAITNESMFYTPGG